MKAGRVRILLIALAAVALTLIVAVVLLNLRAKRIHIALIAPMEDESGWVGQGSRRFIELYLDQVNRQGGIDGRSVVLDIYDDQDDPVVAQQMAQKILDDGRTVAVIGHYSDAAALAAGDVYRQHGIAAITSAAGWIGITRENDWYFRGIYDVEAYVRSIIEYARHVLGKRRLAVVIEERDTQLAVSYFVKVATGAGLEVDQHSFDARTPDLDGQLQGIAKELKAKPEIELILVGASALSAAKVIRVLRDAEIDTPVLGIDELATLVFQAEFSERSKRKPREGVPLNKFYTDDLYVFAPGTFETANRTLQEVQAAYFDRYGEPPEYFNAFAYDCAVAVVHAIEKTGATGEKERLASDRRKIRDHLAKWTDPRDAIQGATGPVYFNEHGDMPRSPTVLKYRNNQPIAALTQLRPVVPTDLEDAFEAFEQKRIVYLLGQYLVKVNVVYTGLEVRKIESFDDEHLIFDVEFDLWFRFTGDPKPEDIQFLNSVKPIQLGEPLVQSKVGDIQYRAYRVKGRFRADSEPRSYAFQQHALGIHFRHRTSSYQSLIYTPDVLGMATERHAGTATGFSKRFLKEQLIRGAVISPALGWSITDASLVTDTMARDARGDPKYLDADSTNVAYSRFSYEVFVAPVEFTLRGGIPREYSGWILVLTALVIALLVWVIRRARRKGVRRLLKAVIVLAAFVGLLSIEVMWFGLFSERLIRRSLFTTERVFDILWWVAAAVVINVLIDRLIWVPLARYTQRPVPQAVRIFVGGVVFIGAFLGITAFVFDQKITSVLATSGVVAMIIGLAIQANIANAFAGLVLNIERPFRIGDWVKIGDFDEGQIIEFTWRSTRLRTWDQNTISIPNSVAIEATSTNYGSKVDNYTESFSINVDVRYSPEKVTRVILEAVLSTPDVQTDPAAINGCRFSGITDWSAAYTVVYTFKNYQHKRAHREAILKRVWQHCHRAGITPATRRQEVRMLRGDDEEIVAATSPYLAVSRLPLFRHLHEDEIVQVSEEARKRRFSSGQTVVRQGDRTASIFVILDGKAEATKRTDPEEQVEVEPLLPDEHFGELTLFDNQPIPMTVTAKSTVTVLEITSEMIARLVRQRPELEKSFEAVLHKGDDRGDGGRDPSDQRA